MAANRHVRQMRRFQHTHKIALVSELSKCFGARVRIERLFQWPASCRWFSELTTSSRKLR
jgi:hypothetical protein